MFKFLKGKFSKFNENADEALDTEAISDDQGKVIRENKLDELLWDLEVGLMESDVAVEVIEELKIQIRKELVGKRVKRGQDFQKAVNQAIKNSLQKVLNTAILDFDDYIEKHEKPVVLMFVGVNEIGRAHV